jgi:hypothetical protein
MDVESSRQQVPKGDSNSMAAASEVFVDWRGGPCKAQKHGGMKAAVFVLGVHPSMLLSLSFLTHRVHVSCLMCSVLVLGFSGY